VKGLENILQFEKRELVQNLMAAYPPNQTSFLPWCFKFSALFTKVHY